MAEIPVKISEGGRIVIPIEFRRMLGVDIGDELLLHEEHGRLILMTRKQAIAYVQEQVAKYNTQRRSLSVEIVAERRAEAKAETVADHE